MFAVGWFPFIKASEIHFSYHSLAVGEFRNPSTSLPRDHPLNTHAHIKSLYFSVLLGMRELSILNINTDLYTKEVHTY